MKFSIRGQIIAVGVGGVLLASCAEPAGPSEDRCTITATLGGPTVTTEDYPVDPWTTSEAHAMAVMTTSGVMCDAGEP